jgi:hypothetical protein
METVVNFLRDFVLLFLLVLIIYFVFINKKRKDYSKLKKDSYIKGFIVKYNLDMRKTNYNEVLNVFAIVNSFILAFTSALILNVDKFIWKVVVSFIVIFVLIYALYEIAGRYLKNKEDKK